MGFYRDGVWQPDATEIASGEMGARVVGGYVNDTQAKLDAANERITNALAMVDEANALAKRNGLALMTEREVSDKLVAALTELYDLEKYRKECSVETIGYKKDAPRVYNLVRATLTEVAAIRAGGK